MTMVPPPENGSQQLPYFPLKEDSEPSVQGYPPTGAYPLTQAGSYPPPISQQPKSGEHQPPPPAESGWMNLPPAPPPNCPSGLEYLSSIDQLLVQQKVELLEVLTGFETQNKYTIKNSIGQKIFYAAEESDCLVRNCCGKFRPFGMMILDNFQKEVIHLERPLKGQGCCCPCWLQKMEVYSPPGCLVGTVEEEWSFLQPHFRIKNGAGDTVFTIKGPFCTMSCCGDVTFEVFSKEENIVGRISKQWGGLIREAFTDADNFGITFPMDLDVRMKAVMLGACFLIDMMFFERHN